MTDSTNAEIVVEEIVPHRPSTVWCALTDAETIEKWLMPNDFRLEVGAFTFRRAPMGDWDGVVRSA